MPVKTARKATPKSSNGETSAPERVVSFFAQIVIGVALLVALVAWVLLRGVSTAASLTVALALATALAACLRLGGGAHPDTVYGAAANGSGAAGKTVASEVESYTALFAGARVPTDSLPRVDSDLVAVAKPNSIALRIAMVAAGEADLVATLRWGYEWDIAAAILIAAEAGATVSDAFGKPLFFNTPSAQAFGVLATTPGIHADAVDRLADRARTLAIK